MDFTSPIFCPKSNPKVTAGLIWHPLTCPMDWAMVATVTPKAKAILWRKRKRYTNTKQHIYMGSRSISSNFIFCTEILTRKVYLQSVKNIMQKINFSRHNCHNYIRPSGLIASRFYNHIAFYPFFKVLDF